MELFSTTSAWAQSKRSQSRWHQQRTAVEAAQTEGKLITAHRSSRQPAARLAPCTLLLPCSWDHQAAALPTARQRHRHRRSTDALEQPSSARPACYCAAQGSRRAAALPTFSTGASVRYQPLSRLPEARLPALTMLLHSFLKPQGSRSANRLHRYRRFTHAPMLLSQSPEDEPTGCTGTVAPRTPLGCLQSHVAAPLQGGQLHGSPSLPGYLQAWLR